MSDTARVVGETADATQIQLQRNHKSRQSSFSLDSNIGRSSPLAIYASREESLQKEASKDSTEKQSSVLSKQLAETPQNDITLTDYQQNQDFSILPSSFDSKLYSYGPYVRVYEKNQQSPDKKQQQVTSPQRFKSQQSSTKYTSIIDVSSSREKLYSTTYPMVIKVPPSISKVQISISPNSRSSRSGPASTITLSRPTSSRIRYQRSNPGSEKSGRHHLSTAFTDPSIPNLPFLQMTNALQLHLKCRVLDDTERILVWTPGSFLIQSGPIIDAKNKSFSLSNFFGRKEEGQNPNSAPPQHFPAYFLLTNKYVYIAKPLFLLAKLKHPLQDEQTSYLDPTKLIDICYKISILETNRMDVGPGRQYIVFHMLKKEDIFSLVFQTRSRQTSTIIIDSLTTLIHEASEANPSAIYPNMNQDVEWCIRSIQDQILLCPGPKQTSIFSYSQVWPISEKYIELKETESDSGILDVISKVDFDFVKLYLFGAFMRYIKPVAESEMRGVEIQNMTILGTRDYLYLLQERLDAWPPSVFPPDSSKNYPTFPYEKRTKGYLVDIVPQFQLHGVGRISDVTRIERWRSWRIDDSFGTGDPLKQYQGLGLALQNGHIGYLHKTKSQMHQQANAGGWFWWIRIHFGTVTESTVPHTSPKQVPICGYWWDVAFATRESSEDFVETIKNLKTGQKSDCKIIIGDD